MYFKFLLILLSFGHFSVGLPYDVQNSAKGISLVDEEQSNRIVGGTPALKGSAPYMVALVSANEFFVFQMCGGSLISKNQVLTAAHCIDAGKFWPGVLSPTFKGVVGSNNYTKPENRIAFTHYINHPGWNVFTLKNDIGILFVKGEIRMSALVGVIALRPTWVPGGQRSHVSGWGRDGVSVSNPQDLQFLEVFTFESQQCVSAIKEASEILGMNPPPVDPQLEICTLHSPGHGMCHGDSGSALVLRHTREQIGIVAWGLPCARGAPDVYVRISAYIPWLSSFIPQLRTHGIVPPSS